LPITPELARHIQSILKDEGFYDGPIDGVVGRGTRSALASYQTRHGLPATAVVDQDTLELLASNDSSLSGSSAQGTPPGKTGPDDQAAPTPGYAPAK
jgi:N-acetylmuramoyl-L-alanine amidase